jgi:hypothetical protein
MKSMQNTDQTANPSLLCESPVKGRGARVWACRAILAVVPVLLVWFVYTRPVIRQGSMMPPFLKGSMEWQLTPDFGFYVYQLTRACESGGRWWEVAEDHLVGGPYQTEAAKTPALYEGVDLMLISAVTGRFLDPIINYHLMILIILAFNGWVAGWMVLRLTRSYSWAVLAQVLITLHFETLGRANGHLHLFKYGWILLAVWAFSRYLDFPSLRRGVLLGLAAALVLQSSFYFGFLLTVALGAWWVGCLASTQVNRRHLGATCAGGITFALLGAALTFPVWMISKKNLFTDSFFKRSRYETWFHSAELWQYFWSPNSILAGKYWGELRERGIYPGEGAPFLGFTVLLAVALYVVARLRGRQLCVADPRMLDRIMGLIAVFALLSLKGGPCFFLYELVGSFRCYSRSGALARALGCVAGPVILYGLSTKLRPKGIGAAMAVGVIALAAFDVYHVMGTYCWLNTIDDPPVWSKWLAQQPSDVRLAAFPPYKQGDPLYWWGINGIYPRAQHKHATLNGCDFRLLEADLKLLGASYDRMNPQALRFVVSLGFETLAFHDLYVHNNPWILRLPWLDWIEARGPWRIARANSRMDRFPRQTLEQLLARQPSTREAVEVPARSWITGQLALDRDVVVAGRSRALVAWADADGKLIKKPSNAMFQHIFGPSLPAFTVKTPGKPGRYDLVFLDYRHRRVASRPYLVVEGLRTSRQVFGTQVPDLALNEVTLNTEPGGTASLRLVLENTSPYFIQTHVHSAREAIGPSARSHPGISTAGPGSMLLRLRLDGPPGSPPIHEVDLLLPRDLPPRGRIALELPADRMVAVEGLSKSSLRPIFTQIGQRVAPTERADVRLVVERGLDPSPDSPSHASLGTPVRR